MRQTRDISEPEPGFFKMKLVKNGPKIAARLYLNCPIDPEFGHYMDRSRHLIAEVDGVEKPGLNGIYWVWTSGERITSAEFEYLKDLTAWCRRYDPSDPLANPTRPVVVNKTKPEPSPRVNPRTSQPSF